MSTFPQLKSGAVAQYPLRRALRFATHVTRFLDGSEQRFRQRPSARKRWVIRLDLLDETELTMLEDFFAARKGRLESFTFVDPQDATSYPDCSFENDDIGLSINGPMDSRTQLIIRQN